MNRLLGLCKKNHFFEIIISFIGTIGIIKYLQISHNVDASYSFITIIFIVFLFYAYFKKPKLNTKENILAIGMSIILSCILILGAQLDNYNMIIWSIPSLIKILFLLVAIFPMFCHLIIILKKLYISKKINLTKKTYIITFIVIFIFNFLGFLALFPGVYGYDAGFQILEILDPKVMITSHFSVIYCFFLAQCINIGKIFFHSNTIGLAIYSFIQMLFMVYVTTRISLFSYKLSKSKFIFLFSVIFFSIFPLHIVMILSTAQDVLFSGIFALIVINLIEYYNTPKKRYLLALIILSFLLCSLRNNGYYAILFLIVISLFIKSRKKMLVISLLISIALYMFTSEFGYKYLNIYKESPIREMSSIMSQQFARTYNYNKHKLTDKEFNDYKHFYKLENFYYYNRRPSISDTSKNGLEVQAVKEQPIKYISFWIKTGFEHPKLYVEAFLLNNLGSWYPNKYYNDDRMYHPYIEYDMLDAKFWNKKYESIERKTKFSIYNKFLTYIVYNNNWQTIPLLSLLFSTGFYFILYLFTLGMCIIYKKKKFYLPLVLMGGLYITIILAPVALFRYSFPIVVSLPILLSMLVAKEKKES